MVTLTLRLTDDDGSRSGAWPHAFTAEYRVAIGQQLGLALDVRNTGSIRRAASRRRFTPILPSPRFATSE